MSEGNKATGGILRKLGLIGFGVTGFVAFVVCIAGAGITYDAIKAGTFEGFSARSIWIALAGFVVAGVCGMIFEHIRLSKDGKKAMPVKGKKKSPAASVNEGKLVGGVLLVGVAIFEFSTNYLADNFLVPYQQAEFLRNVFSSGLFPVVIGLCGLALIYVGIKPFLDKKDP